MATAQPVFTLKQEIRIATDAAGVIGIQAIITLLKDRAVKATKNIKIQQYLFLDITENVR